MSDLANQKNQLTLVLNPNTDVAVKQNQIQLRQNITKGVYYDAHSQKLCFLPLKDKVMKAVIL